MQNGLCIIAHHSVAVGLQLHVFNSHLYAYINLSGVVILGVTDAVFGFVMSESISGLRPILVMIIKRR